MSDYMKEAERLIDNVATTAFANALGEMPSAKHKEARAALLAHIQRGAACFSAGYVAGVKAENARCRQVLTDKRDHYDALPDRALAAQCFDHAQILLGGWAYEAALRGEVK